MDFRADEEAPLVTGEDRKVRPGKSYTRDVHILSISFLLIFLAYGAAQNLETTVNKVLDPYFDFPFSSICVSKLNCAVILYLMDLARSTNSRAGPMKIVVQN